MSTVDRFRRQEDDRGIVLTLGELTFSYLHDRLEHAVAVSGGEPAYEAVNAWTLIGRDLALELDHRSAQAIGVPTQVAVRLNLASIDLSLVRDTLIEILEQGTCYEVDCEGRYERN